MHVRTTNLAVWATTRCDSINPNSATHGKLPLRRTHHIKCIKASHSHRLRWTTINLRAPQSCRWDTSPTQPHHLSDQILCHHDRTVHMARPRPRHSQLQHTRPHQHHDTRRNINKRKAHMTTRPSSSKGDHPLDTRTIARTTRWPRLVVWSQWPPMVKTSRRLAPSTAMALPAKQPMIHMASQRLTQHTRQSPPPAPTHITLAHMPVQSLMAHLSQTMVHNLATTLLRGRYRLPTSSSTASHQSHRR